MKVNDIQEPMVKAYKHQAFPLAILNQKHLKNGYVYNKYIQLVYWEEGKRIDFRNYYFFLEDHVFIKGSHNFPLTKTKYKEGTGVIDQIKEWIDQGFYIYGDWNRQLEFGKAKDRFMLYGYDDDGLMLADLVNDYAWRKFHVDYDCFNETMVWNEKNVKEKGVTFITLKTNELFHGKFDWNHMVRELKDYLKSDNPMKEKGRLYGCQAETKCLKDIKERLKNGKNVHADSLYVLYEHKKIMLERMRFLNEHKERLFDQDTIGEMKRIVDEYKAAAECGGNYEEAKIEKSKGKFMEIAKHVLNVTDH